MKVDRGRVAEALRTMGRHEDATAASDLLPEEVDTEVHADELRTLGLEPEHLLDHLGRGGLGKMIGG